MGYEEKLVAPALKFKNFLDKTPNIHNVYVIAAISCTSGMMFGFDISSMSVFVDQQPYLKMFDNPSSVIQGFITALMSLGSFFGSLTSTFISEPFGRRASLFICGILWVIGAAVQSSSQNRAQLICGRIIAGWGIGFGSSVAPVYGSEMAPRKIRGTIGGIFQFSVTVGIFIMFLIGYGCSFIQGKASFRIPWGVQMIPGLILLIGLFFIPESPRWLAKQGYWEDAEIIVANVQAKGNRNDANVQIEMSEIKDQLMLDEHLKEFTYADLFTKKYRQRTITAIFAQIWQQLTGMNVMMYYIVYIFQMAGYSGNTNLVPSLIQYIINMAVTVPALFCLDLLGRRTILLAGAAFMMAWQFGVAGILATYSEPAYISDTVRITIPDDHKSAAKGVIACCYLFVCSFAFSWGVGIWVYCSEVWGDSQSRQRGAALATSANWIFNFAIAMFTPSSFKNITWKTYIIYATFCACMFIHVFFFFPETKGKRLEEIGQLWDEGVPAWRSAKWQPTVPLASDAELAHKMDVAHAEHADLLATHSPSSDEKTGTV
ncbi:MFS transporter, sugar porter (SP) family [Metschnikowia aff. pulcherrima]|uniref:MFS transporter, sugar porter (SP) family n=1 Tax=Metschnikowia aff. pulcherrima TaxID=2163413 RepID=A0A4P6XMZ0_9ASCO|nr:MFS transporter, sugar porter (SP) family [Metschnikowia aff. pulcherrima]